MKSTRISIASFVISLWVILTGCSGPKTENANSYLPVARGEEGVILAVMDSAKWHGALGQSLKNTFVDVIPGLPQDEPYFTVRQINPLRLNNILKTAKNMLFVTTLDDYSDQSRAMRKYITDESLRKIDRDTSLYMFINRDQFAKGQEILHLFGKSDDLLIDKIEKNKMRLRNHFLRIEKERISKAIYGNEEKNMQKVLIDDHKFSLRIPYGYDLAKNLKNLVWIRFLNAEFEKNILVHYVPFTSQEAFEDPLDYREKITSTYLRDVEKPEIYMTLQDFPTDQQEVNFNGKYAMETRGLWKLSDISSGGPFVSYIFVDESQKRIYYLEGYVYAPSRDKRAFMREMEVILSTFKSGDQLLPDTR